MTIISHDNHHGYPSLSVSSQMPAIVNNAPCWITGVNVNAHIQMTYFKEASTT
ncbi:hypothetical protein BDF19DRAFT_425271 [Syncephalis fuscata]|nr:hypothetical protein BDF19DRAFT_425271 [Syncephalis fuscata]